MNDGPGTRAERPDSGRCALSLHTDSLEGIMWQQCGELGAVVGGGRLAHCSEHNKNIEKILVIWII